MTREQFAIFYELWDNIAFFVERLLAFFNTPLSDILNPFEDILPSWASFLLNPSIWIIEGMGWGDNTMFELMFGIGIIVFLVWGFIKFFLPTA